jgi:aminopeptidase N
VLRTAQFPEDAGPMAHPVRPDQYLEINNFYTVTIYEKGAEVVRMMQTLVGREGFAKGISLYFQRFDGQAVTCDDFAQAIADANPESQLAQKLDQFKRWYSQSGTPRVKVTTNFDAGSGIYQVTLAQSCDATPGQAEKQPFVIPIGLGLLDADGRELTSGMHVLTQASETLTFPGYASEPVPSLLRGFSAPVILEYDYSDRQLLALLAHDTDPFNRWEAGSAWRPAARWPSCAAPALKRWRLDEAFLDAMRSVLRHPDAGCRLQGAGADAARRNLHRRTDGRGRPAAHPRRARSDARAARHRAAPTGNGPSRQPGPRRLQPRPGVQRPPRPGRPGADAPVHRGARQRRHGVAGPRLPALQGRVQHDRPLQRPGGAGDGGSELAAQALQRFHAMFKDEPLVLDKWFALQAGAPDRGGNILPIVKQLMNHADFNIRNPNRARSVIFSYCSANPGGFHRADAAGYVFWSDRVIELDAINPQVAARLARALDRWKKLAEPLRGAAREAIARVAAKPDLSNDVREVVTRALAD